MNAKPTIPFKIVSIDSLGQGVSKEQGQVTFIHKTLPGEEGTARIIAQKKSVNFARLENLDISSPARIASICPHFDQCPSCHFLHTSYPEELEHKKRALQNIFYKVDLPDLKVIGAPRRLGYRNRIQLHYDTKSRQLGMLNTQLQKIVPVPQCLMGLPPVAEELQRLYSDQQWLKEAPKNIPRGHVEIYWKDQNLQVSWNRPYAEGGFSQVFEEMNHALKQELSDWMKDKKRTNLLDLFGGNGNLTSNLPYQQRLCVDIYEQNEGEDFFSQQLYDPKALSNIKEELSRRGLKPELLVIDPPRSGFKELQQWLQEFRPAEVVYVSCDAHTMARDLKGITGYQMKRAFLLDFFPSTFHFETMIFLERKE